MKNLIIKDHGEAFVSLNNIVEFSGVDKKSTQSLIRTYQSKIEALNKFKFEVISNRPEIDWHKAKFNEDASAFLLSLMKNTKNIVEFKFNLIKQFSKMREIIINELCKTFETKELKAENRMLKADKTIQRLTDEKTKLIKHYYARPRGKGWETITRIIKDHKLSLNPEMANSILNKEKIIELQTDNIPVTYWKPSSNVAIASGGSILLHTQTVLNILADYTDVEQPSLFT